MLFPDVGCQQGYFGKYSKSKDGVVNFIPLGREVKVKEVYEIMETQKQSLIIQTKCNNQDKCIEVNRSMLNKRNIDYFLGLGFDCYEHNASLFIKSIHEQELNLPITLRHEGVGWKKHKGEMCFRSQNLIVQDNSNLESNYRGIADIAPRGEEEVYFDMIQENVKGHIPSEFAVVAGSSSIVNAFLAKEVNYESLIMNFYNDSSKGKSISAQLAASISSNPSFNKNPYMTTWNSTPNFMAGILRNNFGICMVIDEGSLVGNKDLTNIFYMLASGKEKGRLDTNLAVRASANWNTTIISTSEGSLLDESNQNEGLRVRVFEFGNVTWTKDAETADAIKKCIQDNYGFIGEKIAQHLVNKNYEEVKEEYLQEVQLYLDAVGKDNFNSLTARIAKKMGILLYTVELVNSVCALGLDKQGILNFLVLHQHKVPSKDIADRAFDCILEQVTIHHNKFYRRLGGKASILSNIDLKPNNLIWGCINEKKTSTGHPLNTEENIKKGAKRGNNKGVNRVSRGKRENEEMYREIVFVRDILINLLKNQGFTNPQVVLQKMRDKGLIDSEKDKLIRRRAIMPGDSEISTYVIIDKRSDLNTSRKIEFEDVTTETSLIQAQNESLVQIFED